MLSHLKMGHIDKKNIGKNWVLSYGEGKRARGYQASWDKILSVAIFFRRLPKRKAGSMCDLPRGLVSRAGWTFPAHLVCSPSGPIF